jgi:two-component system alkaline phosphatase synthesis response regulator PhoP
MDLTAATDNGATPDVIDLGRLEVRPAEYLVTVDGEPLRLTVRELQLLIALARRRDRIVTREELYTAVWRKPFRPDERSVDVYVRKLRRKLEFALPGWVFIHTHFGFGYRLSPTLSQVFHTPATRG